MNKVTIFGAGRVGESTAQFLASHDMCRELLLIDIREGAATGAALDIQETAPLFRFDTALSGSDQPADVAGSDLVIITAGLPRKPGMSRSDVLDANIAILDGIVDAIVEHAPDSMVLLVSNPVDVLTWRAFARSGFPRNRVFGQAGVLDSSRMAAFIAMQTGISTKSISTMVLGGHGDLMVPVTRYCTIGGIPIEQFMSASEIDDIVQRTRDGGAEILALKQTSSAYDAPAAAIAAMVDAIVHDRKRLLPCVAMLDGEYGLSNIAMGVPCILGQGGLERVVEIDLNDTEKQMLANSAQQVTADIDKIA